MINFVRWQLVRMSTLGFGLAVVAAGGIASQSPPPDPDLDKYNDQTNPIAKTSSHGARTDPFFFRHLSDADDPAPGGSPVITNMVKNDHGSNDLPFDWREGGMAYRHLRPKRTAFNTYDVDFPKLDKNAIIRCGLGLQHSEKASTYVEDPAHKGAGQRHCRVRENRFIPGWARPAPTAIRSLTSALPVS